MRAWRKVKREEHGEWKAEYTKPENVIARMQRRQE
jgi:hypothetical protein